MNNKFARSEVIFGKEGQEKLKNSHVAIFGLGGVGSYAVEALARAGVGEFTLVDNDEYSITNVNRQLYATNKTIGKLKTEVAKQRILEINENATVNVINAFVLNDENDGIDFSKFDFIVDAIDTVSGKLSIVKRAYVLSKPVISCMSAGNKLDPTAFKVADIFSTKVCPLCKVMRKLLKENKIDKLTVVYSEEEPVKLAVTEVENGKRIPASVSFVPSVMGLIAGGEVIKRIVGANNE